MRTRRIRLFPVLLAVLVFCATEAYAQTATVVTHSGQRVRGQVVSMGADNYGTTGAYGTNGRGRGRGNGRYGRSGNNYGDAVVVLVNGREQQIPIQDVAFVDFAGNGIVPQSELNRANQSNGGLVVLRNGRTMTGRVVDFQANNNQAVVLSQSGERTVPLNQVLRVYFGNDRTASGYAPYSNPNQNVYGDYNPRYGQNGQNGQYGQYGQPTYGTPHSVTIATNQPWSNSGLDVRRGQVVHFRASGNVTLSRNPGDYATPAGARDGRMAGNSPLPGVTGGLLIGRVGNGQPFAIGAESDITMPANGRLFLGVNDDDVGDNTGNFVVEMFPR